MAHISHFSRDILQWRGAPLIRRLHPPSWGRRGGAVGREERQPEVKDWLTQGHEEGGPPPCLGVGSNHYVTCAPGFSDQAEASLGLRPHPCSVCFLCPILLPTLLLLRALPAQITIMRISPSQALLLDALHETFRYVNNWMEIVYDVLNSTSMNKVEHLFMCPRVICISYSVSSLFINFANIKYYIKYWSL